MATLFRAMKQTISGEPQLGGSARTLGVRLGKDIAALSGVELVQPGEGGLSVSPDDPRFLPVFRRPPLFGGTGVDPIWFLQDTDLGPTLCYRRDPARSGHGFIEPAFPMTADEYRQALEATQSLWRQVTVP